MKKLFTLIAVAAMAVSANAQKAWNFSAEAFAAETITATKTVDGLTIYANEDASVTIDGNKKTFDNVDYTQRLKTGGTGSFDESGTPVTRVLAFDVTGPAKITVCLLSSSSSTDREAVVAYSDNGTVKEIGKLEALGASDKQSRSVEYTGTAATTIYIYSSKGGVNFYSIAWAPVTTDIASFTAESAKTAAKKVVKDGRLTIVSNGKEYSAGGAQVK